MPVARLSKHQALGKQAKFDWYNLKFESKDQEKSSLHSIKCVSHINWYISLISFILLKVVQLQYVPEAPNVKVIQIVSELKSMVYCVLCYLKLIIFFYIKNKVKIQCFHKFPTRNYNVIY